MQDAGDLKGDHRPLGWRDSKLCAGDTKAEPSNSSVRDPKKAKTDALAEAQLGESVSV